MKKIFNFLGKLVLENKVVLVLFVIGIMGIGSVLGLLFLPEEWNFWRRLAGGLIGGLGCGFIVVASRLTGAFADEGRHDSDP